MVFAEGYDRVHVTALDAKWEGLTAGIPLHIMRRHLEGISCRRQQGIQVGAIRAGNVLGHQIAHKPLPDNALNERRHDQLRMFAHRAAKSHLTHMALQRGKCADNLFMVGPHQRWIVQPFGMDEANDLHAAGDAVILQKGLGHAQEALVQGKLRTGQRIPYALVQGKKVFEHLSLIHI